MGHMTVREAAEKWKISERLVQKYCAQGRIQGAKKFGISWEIPEDAKKPCDPRKSSGPCTLHPPVFDSCFMPLMNTAFEPGRCTACIEKMDDGPQKDIAWAEYHYFSGHPERAVQESERYLQSADMGLRLSAGLIYAYANLSIGQIQQARDALSAVKNVFPSHQAISPQLRAVEAFAISAAAILLHLPLPDGLPPAGDYMPLLPPGLRAFGLYVQAHSIYLQGEYGRSLGLSLIHISPRI